MEQLSLHGYHGTGIKQILDQVSVPKGSIYNFFASKEVFVAELIDHYSEGLLAQVNFEFPRPSHNQEYRLMFPCPVNLTTRVMSWYLMPSFYPCRLFSVRLSCLNTSPTFLCSGFQALKDHVRRDKAMYLLNEGLLSMAEIARRISFTEAAFFSRAFKQWTGMAPAMYRKTLQS